MYVQQIFMNSCLTLGKAPSLFLFVFVRLLFGGTWTCRRVFRVSRNARNRKLRCWLLVCMCKAQFSSRIFYSEPSKPKRFFRPVPRYKGENFKFSTDTDSFAPNVVLGFVSSLLSRSIRLLNLSVHIVSRVTIVSKFFPEIIPTKIRTYKISEISPFASNAEWCYQVGALTWYTSINIRFNFGPYSRFCNIHKITQPLYTISYVQYGNVLFCCRVVV